MQGSSDWLERMTSWLFYKDWIISTISAFFVLLYFDVVHSWLDRNYPWLKSQRRLAMQFLLLFLVPLGMAVLITFLQYELLYDQGLVTHGYFQNEFLVTLLIVVLINLSYFVLFLLKKYRSDNPPGAVISETSENEAIAERGMVLIGQRGAQQVPVQDSDIALIWLQSKVVFLKTFEGDQLMLSSNLDRYEQELPETDFFRANRQMIVHRRACSSFESIENGKIRIELTQPFDQSATVSQKKAARFREWIKQ